MLASRRVTVSESIDVLFEQAYEWGWTDGLPIIPPTEERVMAFVKYVGREPEEVVAEIPPGFGVATIEKLAINAVMAGCRPEYFPVLLAAVEAIMEPEFNLNGIQCTTNPAAPLLIINGPIRDQLGINSNANALGQGCRANATIGRALRLVLLNVGGAIPGTVDKATLGQPGKFTFCLGENEEENPWEPLHNERGFSRDQSAVTVVGAAGTNNVIVHGQNARSILTVIANSMNSMGCNNIVVPDAGEPLIILCPHHASVFSQAGLSKADVKRIIWEEARIPLDLFPRGQQKAQLAADRVLDGKVLLCYKPDDLMVIVAGGSGGLHTTTCPTFADTRAVTKSIHVPGNR
ncbi:MAG: hypothetical protein Q7O66_14145 [Dehalococcoidia bacterium]|nr:hypothetical protein [Dehalococcoidia bacterium]